MSGVFVYVCNEGYFTFIGHQSADQEPVIVEFYGFKFLSNSYIDLNVTKTSIESIIQVITIEKNRHEISISRYIC